MALTRGRGVIGGVLAAVGALLATAFPAAGETPAEKAGALLDGVIKAGDPGVAVLVAQDGKILFEKGYGLADREHGLSVSPQTIFRIGSITKQFTASAILKLQEEGKLSVNDPLSKYLPAFPRGKEVTLRELLNHTSGIHDLAPGDEPDLLSRLTKPTTTDAVIGEIKKFPYDFDPGTQWRYDNSGYVLLGSIVEKVSGKSYGDFLRDTFFRQLGMTNTGVYRAHLELPHEAVGYSLGTKDFERPVEIDPSWIGGDGALYSTVEDLYRWNEGIFGERVLDAASLKAAFTAVATNASQINTGNGYGFGWFVGSYRGLRDISHGGAVQGFTSMVVRLPDEKFTVIVLANANGRPDASPERLAYQLVDIYLANNLAPAAAVDTGGSPTSKKP
ncbi:MAG TPA: serine hydrolase domain-containing protein [Phycisphaerae bacterium]|nr:serine hydrolase domain-containing protein [Phycisphaerae bacterium]